MGRWMELKRQVETALKVGNFVEALSLLDAFIASSTYEDLQDCKLLSGHALKVPVGLPEVDFLLNHLRYKAGKKNSKDVPTLHYLACFPYTQKDTARLDKLINIFTDLGYDINTKTDNFHTTEIRSLDATALMAAIEKKNSILLECLLPNGARTDVRDFGGFSPCHWVAKVGNVECLEKLIQFGGPSILATTSIESGGKNGIHPILHTAVGSDATEIVSFLLSRAEDFGLDVNEVATYKNYFSFDDDDGRYTLETYTPLGKAILCRNIPVVQMLLKHPGVKMSGFKELHFCFELGYTDIALMLLERFSDEELISDKIRCRWALHTVQAAAFYKEPHAEFTKKLILEYVRRGWDVNSLGTSRIRRKVTLTDVWMTRVSRVHVTLTKYTLLHLACLRQGREDIIRALVEEAGADVNCKTEGDIEMTPLHILLTLRQWKSAEVLIENGADMNIRGKFKNFQFTRFMRRNLATGFILIALEDLNPCPNSLELLLRMGCEEGLPLLDKVLARTDVVWDGVDEFLLALEGGNPVYISKVLEHCAKTISKKELSWVTVCPGTLARRPKTVSTLAYLIDFLISRDWSLHEIVDVPAFAHLIQLLATLGDKLIVNDLLTIDVWQDSSNLLLRTVLQVDHFRLQFPKNSRGINPVECVLREWSYRCNSNSPKCFEDQTFPSACLETVKLLISHGLDVTGMVINNRFPAITYHQGYDIILKMLYCAGAKFSNTFFTSPRICERSSPETKAIFTQEIADVKLWKDEFDRKAGHSLKHMCRLKARKMLKCIGDLKLLDSLPKYLRDYVLCQAFH